MRIAFFSFTLSRGDEGEVEQDRLGLHASVSLGDGVRDREDLELVGVAGGCRGSRRVVTC